MHVKDFGFYYDGYRVPTSFLESALSWVELLQEEALVLPTLGSITWHRKAYPIFDLRAQFQRGQLLDLSESVLVSALRNAIKPQDNVFAILSLTEPYSLKIRGCPREKADILVPDYGKKFEEVYIDLARRLLYGKMGLSILSLVRNANEARPEGKQEIEYDSSKHVVADNTPEESLSKDRKKWLTVMWPDLDGLRLNAFPSWVPKLLTVPGTQPYYLRGSNMFSAASSMQESFTIAERGRTLKVLAAEMDTVRFQVVVAGVERGVDPGDNYFWPKIKYYFRQKLGPDSTYKHTGERTLSALWRTLLNDMWHGQHPAPSSLEADFIRWLARQETPAKARKFLGLAFDPEPEKTVSFFGTAMCATARTRSFFVTEKGYYGIGPKTVRRGDSIMILPGTQVPYLFRPHMVNEGSWVLIGETYVHGIMHGEVLKSDLDFEMMDIV